jgi:hypothetical protein
MYKKLYIPITLIVALTLATPVMAQDGHSDPYWEASYWNNTTLSGTPVLQLQESALDHDWSTGSPGSGVNSDVFSARWTRYIDTAAGTYRFTATSDDGIRVWVDSALIINEWHDHGTTTYVADKYLTAGHHWVVVEYYENQGYAAAKLSWAPSSSPSTGNWYAEYFSNGALSGSPALTRYDDSINFDWGTGSPGGGIGSDWFSARWTRTLDLSAGNYRFSTTTDDGVRLWVNNHLLIEAWRDQGATTYTGDIYLSGGPVTIKMEYYENSGDAVAKLSWSTVGSPPSPPPPSGGVIVDNDHPGFVKGGSSSGWRTAYEGYNGSLLWTKNNDYARYNYNWARWYPSLSPGLYEVYVYIPERYTTTSNARYWVKHSAGYTLRIVNQNTTGSQWVSLGTYWFNGTDEYVSLSDVTYEPYLSRLIAFDAVKWELRSSSSSSPPPAPATSCSIATGSEFASRLNAYTDVRDRLGCPTAAPQQTWAAEEPFEHGFMIWQEDTHSVYMLYNNGNSYQIGLDPYVEGDPEDACPAVGSAPAGLFKPVRGFNRQWCNLPGVRDKLGWATGPEIGFDATWQRFANGHAFLSREGHIYAFFYNTETWAYIN